MQLSVCEYLITMYRVFFPRYVFSKALSCLGSLSPELLCLGSLPAELSCLESLPPELSCLGSLPPELSCLELLSPELSCLGSLPPELSCLCVHVCVYVGISSSFLVSNFLHDELTAVTMLNSTLTELLHFFFNLHYSHYTLAIQLFSLSNLSLSPLSLSPPSLSLSLQLLMFCSLRKAT